MRLEMCYLCWKHEILEASLCFKRKTVFANNIQNGERKRKIEERMMMIPPHPHPTS
jgi:hypothetical protein